MQLVTGLLNFVLAICAPTQIFAEDVGLESTPLHVGVAIVYDLDVHYRIEYPQGYEPGATKGSPVDYFGAFIRAVNLRFREIKGLNLSMSLVSLRPFTHWQTQTISVPLTNTYETIDGRATMKNLRTQKWTPGQISEEADMIFYVTLKSVDRKAENKTEWSGFARRGEVCKDKFGLISDNGKTFSGVDDMFAQASLLLGASRDQVDPENNCSARDFLLLSSVYGGLHPNLSSCSTNDLLKFLTIEKNRECLEQEPKTKVDTRIMLPSDYHKHYNYDICTSRYSGRRGDVQTCKARWPGPARNKTCVVHCCDYRLRTPFLYMPPAADGTECGDRKICIKKECVDIGTSDSSL